MRRSIAILILVSGFVSATAQNIPNWDFEDWHTAEYYTLDHYYNYPYNVTRSTDHTEGRYAMRLNNTVNEAGTIRRRGYVQNVIASQGVTGFDFGEDVLAVAFDAKYELAQGDSARVYVRFTEDGQTRGLVNFFMWGSTDGVFNTFKVPITWYGPRTPDGVQIYIYSNQYGSPNGNGYLIIDDFHFENIGVRKGDIPNSGFEDWSNTGVQYPYQWRSLDLIVFESSKTFLGENGAVKPSTDAHSGNYSLRVGNYLSTTTRGSYVYVGDQSSLPSFRVFNRYRYIEGYYQFHSSMQDSSLLLLRTFRNGVRISYTYRYFRPKNQWTYFNIPINYTVDSMPDSASLILYSYSGAPNDPEAYLLVDDLALVMGASHSGVDEIGPGIGIHPNPATDHIGLQLRDAYTVSLYSMDGRLIQDRQFSAGYHQMMVADLPPGIYILRFTNTLTQWQTRIQKQ